MVDVNKKELEQQVIIDGREYGISYAIFRNVIGKKLGLNITDFEALDLIFFRGVTTPSELSKYTGVSSGSTTIMIDRLEKAGLVQRKANPKDRRGTLVVINPAGANKVAPLFSSAREAQNKLLASFSERDLKIISDYFKQSADMFETERKKI